MVNYDQEKQSWRMTICSRTQRPSGFALVHYFASPFPEGNEEVYPARNFLMGLQEVERGRGLTVFV